MDATPPLSLRTRLIIFGAVMLVALTWALATNHVWEDYYITYRSSRNLAVGNGLVFNPGERLHTFTSPLGVLLPAAASYLTGTHSDAGAIWVFRIWSAVAFAGAAVLILIMAHHQQFGTFPAVALVALVALDAKSIDFSTNGMETGFLLLFIAYTLWAMFAAQRRHWLHLGLAWGGLMWTRPDGFLYVGLLSAGVFFFNDPARTGRTRGQWLKLFLQAGLVCTAVYLPWLEWAWWYYGTPVPHTITAKGGVSGGAKTVWGAVKTLVEFPLTVWTGRTSLESTFLPSYFQIGGWPAAVVTVARAVAVVLAFQWVLPWRTEVRTASFAYCGLHVYLSYFPFFPFPWYLPGTAMLAAVTLGGMAAQLLAVAKRWRTPAGREWRVRVVRWPVLLVLVAAIGGEGWLTWQMRREMTVEQIYSATGTRRRVGEWLRAHAGRADTVFMEPLGHIGYFSRLKTYDFPGLSSREVVDAIHRVGTDWAFLIDYLCPDWVVLRPVEYQRINHTLPWLFGDHNTYRLVQEFDNVQQIERFPIYGRNYAEFDAHLMIFHRQFPKRDHRESSIGVSLKNLGLPPVEIGGQVMYQAQDDTVIRVKVPAGAKHVWVLFGMPEESYHGAAPSDGVAFMIHWTDGRKTEALMSRTLKPRSQPADRKVQIFNVKLPRHDNGAELILMTTVDPRQPDWGCWGEPDYTP